MAAQTWDTQKRVDHQECVGESRQVEDSIQRPTNGHDYKEGLMPLPQYFFHLLSLSLTKFDMVDDTLKNLQFVGMNRVIHVSWLPSLPSFFFFFFFLFILLLLSAPYQSFATTSLSVFFLLPVVSLSPLSCFLLILRYAL